VSCEFIDAPSLKAIEVSKELEEVTRDPLECFLEPEKLSGSRSLPLKLGRTKRPLRSTFHSLPPHEIILGEFPVPCYLCRRKPRGEKSTRAPKPASFGNLCRATACWCAATTGHQWGTPSRPIWNQRPRIEDVYPFICIKSRSQIWDLTILLESLCGRLCNGRRGLGPLGHGHIPPIFL
jgi:hypothetical protein